MEISIKFDKSGSLLTNPMKFERNASAGINKSLINSGNYILGELQKNTPVGATGILRKNWYMESSHIGINNLVEVEVKNITDYLDTVNSGRKAAPISRDGMKSLLLWVQRKLRITDYKKAISISFAIAKTKKKKDTKGQRFVEETLDNSLPIATEKILIPGIQEAIEDASNRN